MNQGKPYHNSLEMFQKHYLRNTTVELDFWISDLTNNPPWVTFNTLQSF